MLNITSNKEDILCKVDGCNKKANTFGQFCG